jgi:two-component system response regulator HupR/HoxA
MNEPERPTRTVLLVDDDVGNRLTFAALLEDAGYRVVEASSLADGRRRISLGTFEVAILDLNLGDGLGTDLVSELRRRTPEIVIALLTGVSMPPSPGVDFVLVKGSDPGVHLRTLEAALQHGRGSPSLRPLATPDSGLQRRVAGRKPALDTPRLGTPAMRRMPSGPVPRRGRILVVDDDPAARTSIEALLEADYDVETAADVRAAEALLAVRAFDVVITDFEMPGEPGTALLERLRNRPGVVGMLLTGHAEFDEVRRARNDPGIYHVLLKPYQPEMLLHRVRSALAIAQVRQFSRP